MKKPVFTGCAVALITPFHEGEIDYPALGRLIDFQLTNGTDALVACGTTAEPPALTEKEWEQLAAFIIQRADGRVPVIVGTGGNCTRDVIRKAERARALGASAQLCVTPYYNKTTQAGLIAHYTAVAQAAELPVILYNVPSRTGLNLLPDTLARLAEEENIVAVKEASGDMIQIMEMMRLCGDKIAFYSGSDELTAPLMALGGGAESAAAAADPGAVLRSEPHSRKGGGGADGPVRGRSASAPGAPFPGAPGTTEI